MLCAHVVFDSRGSAEFAERMCHVALADYRQNGEWFSVRASVAHQTYLAICDIIRTADFDPDDFVSLSKMTAFQVVDALS